MVVRARVVVVQHHDRVDHPARCGEFRGLIPIVENQVLQLPVPPSSKPRMRAVLVRGYLYSLTLS